MAITKVTGKKIDPRTRKPYVKYRVRVQLPRDPITGKRPSIVRIAESEREAKQLERKLMRDIDTGESVLPDTVNIKSLLLRWLDNKSNEVTSNSWKDYEVQIRKHLIPALGSMRVQRLTVVDVQDQLNRWRNQGMSERMRLACYQRLSAALDLAVVQRIVPTNVARLVKKPMVSSKPKISFWTKEEARAFLDQAQAMPYFNNKSEPIRHEPDPLWPLWPVLLLEGLRRGEALGLHWRDIDLTTGEATIIHTVAPDKSNKGRPVIEERTKTKASKRSVTFSAFTIEELRRHKDRQMFLKKQSEYEWQNLDLVFCTTTAGFIKEEVVDPDTGETVEVKKLNPPGGPINGNNVTRSFNRIKQLTALPDGTPARQDITPHGLRHTCATLLLQAGIHPKVVQERLGHEGIEITLNLYSHVMPGMQAEAASAMDSMFRADGS